MLGVESLKDLSQTLFPFIQSGLIIAKGIRGTDFFEHLLIYIARL